MGSKKVEHALTIRWPFAGAILWGGKDVENRSQRTNMRGRIYVHQSQTPEGFEGQQKVDRLAKAHHGADFWLFREAIQSSTALHGCLIGTVEIVDCIRTSKSPWAVAGEWQYVLANPIPLKKPIPHRGNVGFWKVTI